LQKLAKTVKGRDWYDVIWYIQNNVAVHLSHLRERMRQTKHLALKERFEKQELLDRLHKKIDAINWDLAKSDVVAFVADSRKLDIWSSKFFHDMISNLQVVDSYR
jgi:hypothetical protein